MALSNAQLVIERSVFEAIYVKTLAEGYTADLDGLPSGEPGIVEYKRRLAVVADAKGYAIEIFNYSPADDKGLKKVPRIIIVTEAFLPGDYGIDPAPQPVWNSETEKYDMQVGDNLSYNMIMNVCIVANSTAQIRTLVALINSAIPNRGFIKYESDPTQFFLIELDTFDDLGSEVQGIIEKIYRYSIPDVVWTEPVTKAVVSKLESYDLDLTIESYLGLT